MKRVWDKYYGETEKLKKGFHNTCDYIYGLENCPYIAGHDPKYAECALFPDCGCDGLECIKRYFMEKERR